MQARRSCLWELSCCIGLAITTSLTLAEAQGSAWPQLAWPQTRAVTAAPVLSDQWQPVYGYAPLCTAARMVLQPGYSGTAAALLWATVSAATHLILSFPWCRPSRSQMAVFQKQLGAEVVSH